MIKNLKNIRLFSSTSVSKVFPNAKEAIKDMNNGVTLLSGGFGLCGIPFDLIEAVKAKNVQDLHIVSNNAGTDKHGLGLLINNSQVKRATAS
mmetsp:Transcript_39030/g.85022  ORF Transcript_39030/g.85022 Transcript_39030/m.85022 type:complete len:92 (+) Transcript_39030:3-278(+)